jgi:alkanesulfonate monooxygenase SsuD/methylene tetrahydromethanopterin reductase-like flavin-dependent oxidoreductase (luciferase family)
MARRPLRQVKEYVAIVKKILEREAPLTFDGERYQIPYKGPGATGLGKPLKSILHGRKNIPIYTGSMAPKSQAFAAEVADGLLLTCMHPERFDVMKPNLDEGFQKAGNGKSLADFDIAPTVACILGDDLDACRGPLKASLALYIGGMGAKDKNFYADYVRRVGYEAEANQIQKLFLEGKRGEAIAAVPDALVDAFHLVGPKERIRDRFAAWKESNVGTMVVGAMQPEAVRLIAELAFSLVRAEDGRRARPWGRRRPFCFVLTIGREARCGCVVAVAPRREVSHAPSSRDACRSPRRRVQLCRAGGGQPAQVRGGGCDAARRGEAESAYRTARGVSGDADGDPVDVREHGGVLGGGEALDRGARGGGDVSFGEGSGGGDGGCAVSGSRAAVADAASRPRRRRQAYTAPGCDLAAPAVLRPGLTTPDGAVRYPHVLRHPSRSLRVAASRPRTSVSF